MPFKSKAQERKFFEMYKQGKIDKATLDEWVNASKGKKLPERLKPKKKAK